MRLPILLFLFFEVCYSHPSPQDGQKISLPPGMMQQIMRQIMPNTYPAEGTQTDEPCDNDQPPPNYQPPRYPSDTPYQRKYTDQEDVQRVQNMQQTMNPQHIQKRMAGGYDSPQQYFKPPGQEMGQQNIPANWQGQQQVMERGQILQQQGQQMVQQGEEAMQQRRQEMAQYHQQMQRNYFEARKQLERQQLQLQQQQGDEQSSIQSPQYLRPDVGDAPAYNQMRRFQVPQVQQMTQNFQNDEGDDGYQQPRYLQPDTPHYQYGPVCQRPVPPGPPPTIEEPPRPAYFGRPAPGAPAGQGETAPEQRRVYRRMDTSRIQVVRQESQQAQ